MKRWSILLAATFAAGCAGNGTSATAPVPTAMNQGAHVRVGSTLLTGAIVRARPDRSPSTMSPEAAKGALLYVSDVVADRVYVYSYPAGKRIGSLAGFNQPQGMCVDAAGNMFVTNTGTSQIFKYAHGGKSPIATLSDPKQNPVDCAIDPVTGNLAVTNLSSIEGGSGSVAIYRKAKGKRTLYHNSAFTGVYFLGYDSSGNLFVDGTHVRDGQFLLAELQHGGSKLTLVNFQGAAIQTPGGVQFDGTDLAIGDQTRPYVYRVAGGSVTGTVQLNGACDVAAFWIDGGTLIAPNLCASGGSLQFYAYPGGGSPVKTRPNLSYPIGAAVSKAP
jgi:hypothetical protein